MSQSNKTLIFVAVAAVVLLGVWLTWPAAMKSEADSVVGDKLIASFDPSAAADLQIIDYDAATAEPVDFEVKQVESKGKSLWSIPSHNNYPADAKDQVAQAATSVMGLQILGVKGQSQDDHEMYGVVDPKEAKAGSRGVGMKVVLRDKKGKDLAAVIVGKEVPGHKEQRYVRLVNQNPVYIVNMKTDSLSTRFDRWIEKSLLGINTWDLDKIWIRDHAIETSLAGKGLVQHGEMVLQFSDQGKPQWQLLDNLVLGPKDKLESVKLAPDQELNTAKLDELKNALPELQIIDVARKPDVLSADLKAKGDKSNLSKFDEILADYGFYWANVGNGAELYSNNGEIRCLMKDGVEYVLRFGDLALESKVAAKEEKAGEAKEGQDGKKEEKKGTGLNRYLFVMAQFNPAGIPKPEETPPPGEKPAAGTPPSTEAKPGENPPAPQNPPAPTETKPVTETNNPPVPEAAKPADENNKPAADNAKPAEENRKPADEGKKPADENKPAPSEEKKPVDAKPASYAQQAPTDEKPVDSAANAAKPEEAKPAPAAPAADEKAADVQKPPAPDAKPEDSQTPPAADAKPVEGNPPAAANQPGENPLALPVDPKKLEAEREQVEKENKRKREEYDKKVEAGKKRVEELNARFADWFYIISDETYHKIHLGRNDIIIKKVEKKEEKPGEAGGVPPGGAPGAMEMPPGLPSPGGE